jgi:predicted ATP-dependent endonuclease of OLD family
MFKFLQIEKFGIFDYLNWQEHGQINVLIGETDTGKTYLLKLLYCLAKSLEDYSKRQQSDRPLPALIL